MSRGQRLQARRGGCRRGGVEMRGEQSALSRNKRAALCRVHKGGGGAESGLMPFSIYSLSSALHRGTGRSLALPRAHLYYVLYYVSTHIYYVLALPPVRRRANCLSPARSPTHVVYKVPFTRFEDQT